MAMISAGLKQMFFFVKKGNRGIKEDPLSKNRSTKTISYIFLWLRYLFEKGSSLCQLPAGQQTVREPSEHVVVGDLKLLILILIFFFLHKKILKLIFFYEEKKILKLIFFFFNKKILILLFFY